MYALDNVDNSGWPLKWVHPKMLSHCSAQPLTILNISDLCILYVVNPWNTVPLYVVPNKLTKLAMIVILNLLWSEFSETNDRRFDLLLQIFAQDYKQISSMSRCSTHNLCSEMT